MNHKQRCLIAGLLLAGMSVVMFAISDSGSLALVGTSLAIVALGELNQAIS